MPFILSERKKKQNIIHTKENSEPQRTCTCHRQRSNKSRFIFLFLYLRNMKEKGKKRKVMSIYLTLFFTHQSALHSSYIFVVAMSTRPGIFFKCSHERDEQLQDCSILCLKDMKIILFSN